MADWSPAIANEFIRRARADGKSLTQMQLQKLVYIAHGWNLAINGKPLTVDSPQAWPYGPVYRELRKALRDYGSDAVRREITNAQFFAGSFDDDSDEVAAANLSDDEEAVIDRVYKAYGKFHAFQLSALTHREGTPWTKVFDGGNGQYDDISDDLIREHFVGLTRKSA